MTMKAPFNFVPLSEKVFFPEWADEISQDIPFEDGESGVIELKITAETPVFVRNGHTKTDAETKNDNYKSFSKDRDRYFLPATSIKGAIRNVLEILSFSKMNQIANNRYSLRDLNLKKDYMQFFQNSEIHCGWMTLDGTEVRISDHGIPGRITHEELDKILGTKFSEIFSNENLMKDEKYKSPLYKIQLTKDLDLNSFTYREVPMNPKNPVDKRRKMIVDSEGNLRGKIVFTGQPGVRKSQVGQGKWCEFVFPESSLGTYTLDTTEENGIFEDFCFVHKDSEEWQYWLRKLQGRGQVPVFFALNSNHQLLHFGLSYLYKLPYRNRVKDCLPEEHKSVRLDLGQCIFGYTSSESALKGRVQFSHAFMESGNTFTDCLSPYMASPQSSYYLIYLQQKGENGIITDSFQTMMSTNSRLKGWKRYPVRPEVGDFQIPEEMNEANLSPFIPLQRGSTFQCKVYFHNLKTAELGALLKAVNFRPNASHSIGFAKPYGYGRVKIQIDSLKNNRGGEVKYSIEEYENQFYKEIQKQIPDYLKSSQLRELYAMSEPQDLNSTLEYMSLPDYMKCKKQNKKENITGEYLPDYSTLIRPKKKEETIVKLRAEAKLTVYGQIKQAALSDGKDTSSKTLTFTKPSREKLKIGDKVEVEVIKKNGKIQELIFIHKI